MSDPKYLLRGYTTPRNAGSFGGVSTFARARKLKDKYQLRNFLSGVESYSLHFPVRRKFQTRPLLCSYVGDLTSSDLADFTNLSSHNSGYKFILVFNDCLSKLTYFEAIKDKSSKNVSEAFKRIFLRFKHKIKNILTDHGTEFLGLTAKLFKERGIRNVHVNSLTKASPSENRIKWLRMRIARHITQFRTQRWIDVLSSFEKSYNDTYNISIEMKPNEVTPKTQDLAWHNAFKKHIKKKPQRNLFSVGDLVRVSRFVNLFDKKSFQTSWSKDLFRIKDIKKSFGLYFYKLTDLENNDIEASFYKSEIQKVQNGLT